MQLNLRKWAAAGTVLAVALSVAHLLSVYLQRNLAPAPTRISQATGIPEELDTVDLKILNFYTPNNPVRGEPFLLCYGVINADSVALDPPLADIRPSLSRCVEATLQNAAELTLLAEGRNGERAKASFTIGVTEPRPEFTFINISGREVKSGSRFTICYGVKHATSIRMEPPAPTPLEVSSGQCFMWPIVVEPRRLIAQGAGGREEITLPVKILP